MNCRIYGKEKRVLVAVSNAVFIGITVLLVIIAAIGYALAVSGTLSPAKTITSQVTVPTTITSTLTQTTTSTITQTISSVMTQTITSTITKTNTITNTITQKSVLPTSASFYDGKVITFIYTQPSECVPPLITFFPDQSQANKTTMGCEVGATNMSAFPKGAEPIWVLVPAFAGLSIFGVPQLGATPQGFPTFTYNNVTYTILTHCGASLTPAQCQDHMALIYSPAFTVVEKYLNITNGVFGLPEGVLPTPAHSHLVDIALNQSIPWYLVIVLVFDPNIFPNPVTGQCYQIVPSNLTNPTANCLNSISALIHAMGNISSSVMLANSKNPIWQALGKPMYQVIIPGITSPSMINNANSNMVLYFSDPEVYPYPSPINPPIPS